MFEVTASGSGEVHPHSTASQVPLSASIISGCTSLHVVLFRKIINAVLTQMLVIQVENLQVRRKVPKLT